uniref:Probable imidazolonepropionase n=1 Tax=Syphacia muris TaxID=451379 RepID=A0A0N5AM63_9BILA
MKETREASEELLATFDVSGNTTLEAKSGYGLNTDSELKMLNVIDMAATYMPIEIIGTFCGGHAIPVNSDEKKQTAMIIDEMIPEIAKQKREGRLKSVENIDVFCEKNSLFIEITFNKKILEAGKDIAGLEIMFHAEELHRIGGAEMGASIHARSMSHLEHVSDEGIKAMTNSGTAAILLLTTVFTLRLQPRPARQIIEQGVMVALGSAFNPNAYCMSMPMFIHLACINMKMSMSEALVAATINAAYALGRGKTHGALTVGRRIDYRYPKWEHLIYQVGCHNSIIKSVIKNGDVVYSERCTP